MRPGREGAAGRSRPGSARWPTTRTLFRRGPRTRAIGSAKCSPIRLNRAPMPNLNAIGIVASDMAESIRFYRLLGLDVPETPDEGHVDTFLPNGVRFMLDTEETMRSFREDWAREQGNQIALAFECGSPAEV